MNGRKVLGCALLTLSVGLAAQVSAVEEGYVLRLKRGEPGVSMGWVGADGKQVSFPLQVDQEERWGRKFPEASLAFWHRWGRFSGDRYPRYYVRPRLNSFCDLHHIKPEGAAITNAWNRLPGVYDKALRMDVLTDEYGETALWIEGSWMTQVAPPGETIKDAVFTSKTPGVVTKVEPLYRVKDLTRFLPIDLKLVPRPGSFTNAVTERIEAPVGIPWRLARAEESSDVAMCRIVQGAFALECDAYTRRSPADAYPFSIHYRVPARLYKAAHLVVALENDTNRFMRVAHVRTGFYQDYGSGSCLYEDSTIDWRKGIPADCRKIGTVRRGSEVLNVYYVVVPIVSEKIRDVTAGRWPCMDVEMIGPRNMGWARHYPDNSKKSAFHVLGLTLEKGDVGLDQISDKARTVNAWTADEKVKNCGFTVRSQVGATTADVSWRCTDVDGREVLAEKSHLVFSKMGEVQTVPVNLNALKDPGLFHVAVEVTGADGFTVRHRMRAAVLVPSGRVVTREKSPYTSWTWNGAHGQPRGWDRCLSPLKMIGVRKATGADVPGDMLDKYDMTFAGWVIPLRQSELDPKTGRFRDKDGKTGEERFVADLKAKIAARKYVDHVMIWHEGAPGIGGGMPEELIGRPVPKANDAQRYAAAYLNECGRILRKHFPGLKTRVGNSGSGIGAMAALGRAGANFDYVDTIGNEDAGQYFIPERDAGGLCAVKIAQDVAQHYAKRPVAVDAAYEFVTRRDCILGERMHAAWMVRDALISLADGYTLLDLFGLFECSTGYADTLWGSGGMVKRMPYCGPKEAYVAAAALTKAMDGVKLVKRLDTGSSTIYAYLFQRADGRYATGIWAARGDFELEVDVPGGGTVMDLFGRTRPLRSWFLGAKKATAGECPAYILTEKPVEGVKVVRRWFPRAEALAKDAKRGALATTETDAYLKPSRHMVNPYMRVMPLVTTNDHFVLETVMDEERGKVLELRHLDERHDPKQSKYIACGTTINFKKPIPIAGSPQAIGVWVKGNSNWGAVRFEIVDAVGKVWDNYMYGWEYNPFDWGGTQCVNFDGWCLVTSHFSKAGAHWDERFGLIGQAIHWPWARRHDYGEKPTFPIKVKAISFEFYTEKFCLDGYRHSAPAIRLQDVVGIE